MLAQSPEAAEIEATLTDDEAMAEYEVKGGVSHEAVMAWVRSWGTQTELPPPEVGD